MKQISKAAVLAIIDTKLKSSCPHTRGEKGCLCGGGEYSAEDARTNVLKSVRKLIDLL